MVQEVVTHEIHTRFQFRTSIAVVGTRAGPVLQVVSGLSWLSESPTELGSSLGRGCHSGASLTSFFMELPGNVWPGAVACFIAVEEALVWCAGLRLRLAVPAQTSGEVWGLRVVPVSWGESLAQLLSEQPSLACQLSL